MFVRPTTLFALLSALFLASEKTTCHAQFTFPDFPACSVCPGGVQVGNPTLVIPSGTAGVITEETSCGDVQTNAANGDYSPAACTLITIVVGDYCGCPAPSPTEPPVEAPVPPPTDMPVEAPVAPPPTEAPVEAPVPAPVLVTDPPVATDPPVTEAPVEAPVAPPPTEAPVEAPVAPPPTEAPVAPPPTEAPVEAPVAPPPTEAPVEAPVAPPPTEAPVESPALVPTETTFTVRLTGVETAATDAFEAACVSFMGSTYGEALTDPSCTVQGGGRRRGLRALQAVADVTALASGQAAEATLLNDFSTQINDDTEGFIAALEVAEITGVTAVTAVDGDSFPTTEVPAPAPEEESDDGLSGGAIAGIVVGGVVGAIVIAIGIYYLSQDNQGIGEPRAISAETPSQIEVRSPKSKERPKPKPQPNVAALASIESLRDGSFIQGPGESQSGEESTQGDGISVSSLKQNYTSRMVLAPPGKLGIVIDTTMEGPVVHRVNPQSILQGEVFPGDIIVAVDDVDTRAMSASAITALMVRTSNRKRQLTVLSADVSS